MNYDDTTLTTDNPTPATSASASGRWHRLPAHRHARPALREQPVTEAAAWRPQSQDDLAPSGARTRVRANLAALRVVAELGLLPRSGGVTDGSDIPWSGRSSSG